MERTFSTNLNPIYSFGVPRQVEMSGIRVDMDAVAQSLWSKNNDVQMANTIGQQVGIMTSAWEHRIPEMLFTNEENPGEAVSAVKALAIASAEGQRIYQIQKENVNAVLPVLNISTDVKDEIRASVAVGKVATVSQNNITVGGWTGVGYIIADPDTGAGAYRISGGENGGQLSTLQAALGLLFLFAAISHLAVVAFCLSVLPLFLTTLAALIITVYFDDNLNVTCSNFLIGIGLGVGLFITGPYMARIAAVILTALASMMATGEMDADTCMLI